MPAYIDRKTWNSWINDDELDLREGGTPFHLSPSLHKKGRHDRRGWGAQMDENFEGDGIFLIRENHKKKKKGHTLVDKSYIV
jgi:hypothetical protein